jgi:serine/threonine protein kinase
MTPERWQEVKKVLASALELKPEERRVYLDQSCPELDLRREVESLLAAHEQGDGTFLERLATADGEPIKIGHKFGPYEILARIGAGGMGVVYRARDERLERDVAIKVLPPGALIDEEARRRFRKEALALAKLNHPNIAAVYDVGEQNGTDYLVMECVRGQRLAEKVKSGALLGKEVVALGEEIARALEEAHEQGVVHRDLKPGNILVTPAGHAKVLDFGLAKLLAPADANDVTQSLAETRGPVGTPQYMAPETLRGEPADTRTDLWGLGVVLYEMAAGHAPFQGKTRFELSAAILREDAPPLPATVPAGIQSVVARCVAKERANRYQSATEARSALEALRSSAGTSTRLQGRAGKNLTYASVALLMLAASVGALLVSRSVRQAPAVQ